MRSLCRHGSIVLLAMSVCVLQGPLGHPSTHFAAWFVPAGCCDPQGCHCLGSTGASSSCCLGISPSRGEMLI